jgi:hypothetical protein
MGRRGSTENRAVPDCPAQFVSKIWVVAMKDLAPRAVATGPYQFLPYARWHTVSMLHQDSYGWRNWLSPGGASRRDQENQ